MAKSLSERIAERMRTRTTNVGAQNRGTFLALKSEITDALDNRWPVRTIWETLHEEGKVQFGYQAFRNYVNSLILAPKRSVDAQQKEPAKASAASAKGKRDNQSPAPATAPKKNTDQVVPKPIGKPAGFDFDPNPKKEDYI
ncbi:TraK family protein [Pseudomonas syringae]|uniref:TraK family protein n=1 Tax=Pseudomonas syringae TaxID=317 RepID=UPI0002099170|nr:TraK family protein [Pseudomonas syringae]MDP5168562.1 TraK family protein [Pseudomonas syringae pv. aptata str. DSM 50252]